MSRTRSSAGEVPSHVAVGIKRERFLPFAHERLGLSARVTRCVVDGEAVAIDAERHLIDLERGDLERGDLERGAGRAWRRAELTVSVEITEALLERVFPEDERAAAPGALFVTLRCDETRLREGHPIASAPLGPGRYEATLTLDAARVYGAVELTPQLVRTEDRTGPADAYARAAGARLASGRAWELRSELLRPPPPGKHLEVRYASFAEDLTLARFEGNLYHLEADTERPLLWLNRDHQLVATVLDDKGTTGRRARLREVAFDLVSVPVWTQLFWCAAAHIDEEGASRRAWEEAVLRELLPAVVPARDHPSRALELRRRMAAGEHLELLQALDRVLQQRLDLVRHLEALIREVQPS